MRHSPFPFPLLSLAVVIASALVATTPARAADAVATPNTDDQVIVPQVERREVHKPKYPSNDIEFGLFSGGYSTQNFGVHGMLGARVGYDITEDFFVEATYAQTEVTDKSFRQILPGGVFSSETQRLQYYDLSLGYNVLPGEVFIGKNWAKASTLYLIGGIGNTSFDAQRMQTWNFGIGSKLFLADWVALRVDARNHIFTLDLLGKRQTTQNPELTIGLSFFY